MTNVTQFAPAAMPDPTAQDRAVDRLAEASHRLNEAAHGDGV